MSLLEQTIVSAGEKLLSGACTSEALTETYLTQTHGMNNALNAYITIGDEDALRAARASDERRARGESRGPLDGIPLAIKDNILIQDMRATAGSRILESYNAPYDATVIEKLRTAGAVFLGKTNLDEFSMGSTTENSAYGPTKNPRDLDRVPGGSSGGNGCAVAADLCVAAIGSDTGGSIRLPASFCGIVGFKPSYGEVSRYGLIAMASSLDQIGPMTKTVQDAEILFNAIRGQDAHDQTTRAFPGGAVKKSLKGLKIGLPREAWGEGMTSEVRATIEEGIEELRRAGAECVEVDLPYSQEALAVYYVLMPCEVSANMSRFDGIRYGHREQAETLLEVYERSRHAGLGPEVRRRILIGSYALSKGYVDAYYRQARKVQTLIRAAYAQAFTHVDVLLMPVAPSVAYKQGEKTTDPLAMYLGDIFTVAANVAGLPAISLPCGSRAALPVGLQLIGAQGSDDTLLAIARDVEPLISF